MAVGEKSYRSSRARCRSNIPAWESGLDRVFVRLDKGEFLGREALARLKGGGAALVFRDARGARRQPMRTAPRGNEAIHKDGTLGWPRPRMAPMAGEWARAWHSRWSRPEVSWPPERISTLPFFGKPHKATVIAESPYDPENAALRFGCVSRL